jgi:hypothetical protein
MNLVGKIFTVLIFLMCVVFATFALMAHAAHKNWKAVVVDKGGLNDQLVDANKQIQDLKEEKKNLETAMNDEKERVRKRLISLEQLKVEAVRDRDAAEKELATKVGENRELAAAIKGIIQKESVMQAAIDTMRADIKVAVDDRDNIRKKLLDTTDDLNAAVVQRQKLEKLQRELVDQIEKLKRIAQYVHASEADLVKTPPDGLEGEVVSAPRPDVVEISVGADDGVRKGHKFVVTRPSTGKYIGLIEVIQADYPNRAVCRPDKSSLSDQIQKGDHVKAYIKPR